MQSNLNSLRYLKNNFDAILKDILGINWYKDELQRKKLKKPPHALIRDFLISDVTKPSLVDIKPFWSMIFQELNDLKMCSNYQDLFNGLRNESTSRDFLSQVVLSLKLRQFGHIIIDVEINLLGSDIDLITKFNGLTFNFQVKHDQDYFENINPISTALEQELQSLYPNDLIHINYTDKLTGKELPRVIKELKKAQLPYYDDITEVKIHIIKQSVGFGISKSGVPSFGPTNSSKSVKKAKKQLPKIKKPNEFNIIVIDNIYNDYWIGTPKLTGPMPSHVDMILGMKSDHSKSELLYSKSHISSNLNSHMPILGFVQRK